ncbi:hypothetical protein [Ruminococcus sp. HUN007]|uniref:hypothetical protein n=1 Tax=Ruminococcus sp. HUN007 TaxID=1514668 RepID=UPI0005D2B8C4|nr:hypothetical protein [Ruminococcus sp. HUN007]
MKKILCCILSLALVSCAVCGCEKDKTDTDKSTDTPAVPVVADSDVTPNDASEFVYEEKDGNITVRGYKGNSKTVNIPSEIDGKPVVSIAEYAFDGFEKKRYSRSERSE